MWHIQITVIRKRKLRCRQQSQTSINIRSLRMKKMMIILMMRMTLKTTMMRSRILLIWVKVWEYNLKDKVIAIQDKSTITVAVRSMKVLRRQA